MEAKAINIRMLNTMALQLDGFGLHLGERKSANVGQDDGSGSAAASHSVKMECDA